MVMAAAITSWVMSIFVVAVHLDIYEPKKILTAEIAKKSRKVR
jgi:hypothetical protein